MKVLTSSHIKKISKRFNVTPGQAKEEIINFLLVWKWNPPSLDFEEKFLGWHHKAWLSILKICVEKENPIKRWEKAKMYLSDILDRYLKQSPSTTIYEILRKPEGEFDFLEPSKKEMSITTKVIYPNFFDECLKTVVLFNAQDIKLPPNVVKEYEELAFTAFRRFMLNGTELVLKLEDGSQITEFVPGETMLTYFEEKNRREITKRYFPKYQRKKYTLTMIYMPDWKPTNHLLDFHSLKTELAEACIKKLDSKQRENILTDLAPILDYTIFNLHSFREVVDQWKKEGEFKKIRLLSRILNKAYSKSRIKKSETNYSYVRIYLEVIKLVKQANKSVLEACKTIATNRDKKVEYIRRRYYQVAKEVRERKLSDEELKRRYRIFDI